MSGRPTATELRLLPATAVAWVAAGTAIGAPDSPWVVVVCIALWLASLVVAVVRRRASWRGLLVLALAGGAVAMSSVLAHAPARTPQVLIEAAHSGRVVELHIEVTGRATSGRIPGTALRARVAGASSEVSSPVLVFGSGGDPVIRSARIGSTIRVTGTVSTTDPGDSTAFLVFARGQAAQLGPAPPLLALADTVRADFRAAASELPGDGGDLLPGLAIGDTGSVTATLDDAMKVASLSHLTAVSGANCAIVVGLVLALGAAAGLRRLLRIALAGVVLAGFVVLVTPEPSVLRAAVMAAVALVALASGRAARGVPVLCVAVLILLVVDPWLSRSYGFALSALATGGLLLLARPLSGVFARFLPRRLALVLAVPVAAQLACQPVLLLLAPSLPLYGIAANLLAEPAAAPVTVLGLVACVAAPAFPPLATVVAWIAWVPASWIAAVATFFAGLPGARLPWPGGIPGVLLLGALTVAALVAMLGGVRPLLQRAARIVCLIALVGYLCSLVGTQLVQNVTRPGDWEFAVCDVGQGDATLIRSGGMVALDDTGPEPERLQHCLEQLGITRIDLLVLTHYDLDHVGGVSSVYGKVTRAIIGPPSDPGDERIASELRANGARVDQVSAGESGVLGELRWDVVWPPPRGVEPGNPASVTITLTPVGACGNGCLSGILLGDLGQESQARLLASGRVAHVDVVKVAHHGSSDQSALLYERVRSTVGLIGVGAGNDYGHPTRKLLDILAAASTRPLRTDLDGLVLVAPGRDGGPLRVWTEKPEEVRRDETRTGG
jgi:competence protein ComEC